MSSERSRRGRVPCGSGRISRVRMRCREDSIGSVGSLPRAWAGASECSRRGLRSGQPGRACTAARLARTAQSGEGPAGDAGPRSGHASRSQAWWPRRLPHQSGWAGRARPAEDIHSRVTRTGRTGEHRLGWQLASCGDECSRRGPSRASRVESGRSTGSVAESE